MAARPTNQDIRKIPFSGAIHYALTRMRKLRPWLDHGFLEPDSNTAENRKDNGPENIALLRRLALNLTRIENSKDPMKAKLKRAGWDDAVLAKLLACSPNA